MSDLDNILRLQEADIARDKEVDRILQVNPGDYFAILQINPLYEPENLASQVKRLFRKKSLLIHPDKVKHADAPKAFDALKQAELVLGSADEETVDDETKRRIRAKETLLDIYKQVSVGLNASIVADFDDKANVEIREKVELVLESQTKQEEVERLFNQRQEANKNEELKNAAKDRQLRKQWESKWEDDRDARVQLWRTYVNKVDKKKKPKRKVLA